MGSSSLKRICSSHKKAMKLKVAKKANPVSGAGNTFIWWKKPADCISAKVVKNRRRELMEELDKIKKRRIETEIKKDQREEEREILAREQARAESPDWEKKEEEFLFHQSKIRSKIRLCEGRVKPIDMLLSLILKDFDDVGVFNEPAYMVFNGLMVEEMEELRGEIEMHRGWDKQHVEFWEALMAVCDWELVEARRRGAKETGLNSSIEADVTRQLEGKTLNQLETMQQRIESDMRTGSVKIVEFWEATLKHLHLFKAKAYLREMHVNVSANHPQDKGSKQSSETDIRPFSPKLLQDLERDIGSFSPKLLQGNQGEEAIDPEVDISVLEHKRKAVVLDIQRRTQETVKAMPAQSVHNLELKAMNAMGAIEEGELVFGNDSEISLNSPRRDKFFPKKPKYLNRVHTGFEWNKYNQTHYDYENPPPKTVQGYKFNIFFPDLIGDNKPTYVIERDGDNEGTCVIRFHAGPPYEDIAFRIVNKDWETSHKKGFKCTFDRGVLHLYFNFKRYRYRR